MGWDRRWMEMAGNIARWSKDRSRKAGAVIIDDRNVVVSFGWNGFPRGVNDDVEGRHERPLKYKWTVHAEVNTICNAAANGLKMAGCKMYLCWYPCAPCAGAIIQAGIREIIAIEPDWGDEVWGEDFAITHQMFREAKMKVRFWKVGDL